MSVESGAQGPPLHAQGRLAPPALQPTVMGARLCLGELGVRREGRDLTVASQALGAGCLAA